MSTISRHNPALDARLDALARRSRVLDEQQAGRLSRELGVPIADVQTRFHERQRTLDGAIAAAEATGARTQGLRANRQGGPVLGQAVASATSPALLGANLKVPGEEAKALAKQWRPVIAGVVELAARAKRGLVSAPAAGQELQALLLRAPDPTALWSPAGDDVRAALNTAMDALAKELPKAVVARVPETGVERHADESALASHIQEAQHRKDDATARQLAARYVERFPDAPLAAWARRIVVDVEM